MKHLLQDLRFAVRQIRKNPGFTAAAVLCIALGIGANAATFSFAKAFLWHKSMARESDRLVRIFVHWANGINYGSFSYPDYEDVRDRNDVFTGLVASAIQPFHLSTADRNEKVWGALVSGNYFSELGIQPALGRGFLPEEDRNPGTHPVVVISHGLWQRRFGSDPGVIGKTVLLNARRCTVTGVAPEGFSGTDTGIGQEIWAPMMMAGQLAPQFPRLTARGSHWINTILGRLKPGITLKQAESSVNALMAALSEEHPDTNKGKSVQFYSESEASLHPVVRTGFVMFMQLMFGVVGFILLLACANVAGLLLARSAARRKEIAIRMALGAGRLQIIRQLMAESMVLSLLGGGFGLVLAVWLTRLVQSIKPPIDLPFRIDVSLDWTVLAFAFSVTVLTGLLFGLTPALASTRPDLVGVLKEGNPVQLAASSRLRRVLVAGQVGLSLALMIGAGLVVRSLQNARHIDIGFDPENQIMAIMDLGLQGYDEAKGKQFVQSLRERLHRLPGVQGVGFASNVPLHLSSQQSSVVPEGYTPPPNANNPSIEFDIADPGYFDAMRIPILRGRGFLETDSEDAPPVLVVNQAFARRFWPGQDPVGKRVRTGGREHQVVGMVSTGKYFSLGEDPKPFFYRPMAQNYRSTLVLHVRTALDPKDLLDAVRKEVRALDETLPLTDLKTMKQGLAFALMPAQLAAGVVSSFAVLALLLAAIGLYGVIAYSVSQSTRDIGIRMALGARPADVIRLVVRGGMAITGFGLVLGLGAGFALTRLMTGLLYGISPGDPLSYASAVATLSAAALLAAFLPARRATKVDPMTALRET